MSRDEHRVHALLAECCHENDKADDTDAADNDADHAGTDVAHLKSEEHAEYIDGTAIAKDSKRCSAGNCVIAVVCHDLAERNQQERAACQSRVHKVLAKTSEEALAEQDGKYAAGYRAVKRDRRRQAERHKKTCQNGRAVVESVRSVANQIKNILSHHTGKNTCDDDKRGTETEVADSDDCKRYKSYNDIEHDSAGRDRVAKMRRGGYML